MISPIEVAINDDSKVLERVHPFKKGVVEDVGARLTRVLVCNINYFTFAHVEGQLPFLRPGELSVDVIFKKLSIIARINLSI